jgi:IPT/TIG domain.
MIKRNALRAQVVSILLTIFLALGAGLPAVYATDQPDKTPKNQKKKTEKAQQNMPAKGKAEDDGDTEEPTDKKPKADAEELSNRAAISLVKKFVRVNVSILGPKNVADAYGRRIAHRFVAIQIVIRNRNTSHDFLLHEVALDLRNVVKDDDLTPPDSYNPSSTDLNSLRGVSEKGQAYDPRNLILRMLRGAGTIAAGLIGVTTFGSSYSPSVAVFNGPVLSAFSDTFPDSTINQVNRLNDEAYSENVLVPKGTAKRMTAFIDLDTMIPHSLQKKYYSDPMAIVDQVDFREAVGIVRGIYVTRVVAEPLLVNRAVISPDQMKHFQDNSPTVEGAIIGRGLNGAVIGLDNQDPKGLSIEPKGTPEPNRLEFTIKSTKPVKPDTVLEFAVTRNEEVGHTSLAVRYFIDAPTLDKVEPAEATQGGDPIILKLTGTNFIDGFSNVTISGDGVKITTIKVKDDKSIEATITVDAKAKPGDRNVVVDNGARLESKPITLTIKEKAPETTAKPGTATKPKKEKKKKTPKK